MASTPSVARRPGNRAGQRCTERARARSLRRGGAAGRDRRGPGSGGRGAARGRGAQPRHGLQLGAIHLSASPPNLAGAALAIDAFACLVEGLGDRWGPTSPRCATPWPRSAWPSCRSRARRARSRGDARRLRRPGSLRPAEPPERRLHHPTGGDPRAFSAQGCAWTASWPGTSRPFDVTTRHHGTSTVGSRWPTGGLPRRPRPRPRS